MSGDDLLFLAAACPVVTIVSLTTFWMKDRLGRRPAENHADHQEASS